jgi:membrane-associated phospholipid phosphatase
MGGSLHVPAYAARIATPRSIQSYSKPFKDPMHDQASIRQMIWYRQFIPRLGVFFVYKGVAEAGFMAAFFTAYFLLLNFPVYAVTQMPVTALDRAIGFHPLTLVLYFSLWLYVSLAPSWMIAKEELVAYLWASLGLAVSGCAIFYFWPTATPPPDVDWSRYPGFGFLRSVDDSGNACPSLHVAFAVFSGIWTHLVLRRMRCPVWVLAVNACWCLGIVYSTLSTKQHVVLDAVAGTVLGAVWFLIHLQLILPLARKRQSQPVLAPAGTGREPGPEQV